jgi:hypothetical protein
MVLKLDIEGLCAIQALLENQGHEVDPDDIPYIVEAIGDELRKLQHAACLKAESEKPPRGRKSSEKLTAFVTGLILVFEKFSKKKFTVLRYRNDRGQYEAITDGHRFVVCAG